MWQLTSSEQVSQQERESKSENRRERERGGGWTVILYNLSSEVASNTPAIFYSLECH